jgi:hypothetical protein
VAVIAVTLFVDVAQDAESHKAYSYPIIIIIIIVLPSDIVVKFLRRENLRQSTHPKAVVLPVCAEIDCMRLGSLQHRLSGGTDTKLKTTYALIRSDSAAAGCLCVSFVDLACTGILWKRWPHADGSASCRTR